MRFRDRGVYHFAGRVRCPFAGLGTRGDFESNRLALDDDRSEVELDTAARRIVLYNDHLYPQKTIVGDALFLAEGTTASGHKSPFSVHLKVLKKGRVFSFDLHRHLRSGEPLAAVEIEPFEVIVRDAVTRVVALTPERTRELCLRPSLALRVVKAIMATRDLRQGVAQDPAQVGYRVADLSVGFGALGVHHGVVRAQLVSLDAANAPLIRRGSVAEMLREGAWELSLTALSKRWLDEVIARDLFVFGLEGVSILGRVRERGLEVGETLSFRFERGGGSVVLGEAREELPGATDVARAYLEFHLLGGLLAEHAEGPRQG
ncbi:uncharacterized protein SOCE26_003770 [Sorangium cellulosum]|uniref:Uncharacterized protein n=1 Tax=Sorangium cellulosum TaxID=56 RepID=A0A2L0EI80_SORCE|nr:hypothetical protein [Sorangium cellulosum]AUX38995.1 uncharacterized protein SOCE26_003770 [Sorangium cellulosum]